MKTFRAFFRSCLLAAAVLASPGCATTSTSSKTTNSTCLAFTEKKWDDQTPVEKTGTVLWWGVENALLVGGVALGGH